MPSFFWNLYREDVLRGELAQQQVIGRALPDTTRGMLDVNALQLISDEAGIAPRLSIPLLIIVFPKSKPSYIESSKPSFLSLEKEKTLFLQKNRKNIWWICGIFVILQTNLRNNEFFNLRFSTMT